MKAVLLSIQPKWCAKIVNGEKSIEVRKTQPKLKTPFKCYIYCTAGVGKNTFCVPVSHKRIMEHYAETGSMDSLNAPIGNGKVIGEFVCDKIFDICIEMSNPDALPGCPFPATGLTDKEILQYLGNGNTGYGWHITQLKIYDEPKELEAYGTKHKCNLSRKCTEQGFLCAGYCKLTRPPQSWCYVEELQNA